MEIIATNNKFTTDTNHEMEARYLEHIAQKELYASLSPWGKFKYRVNQFLDSIRIIRCICCFTSIFSLIGTIILLCGGSVSMAGAMFAIGLPSALLACPFKLLSVSLSLIVGGFSIGLCFLGFGCLIGAAIGIILSFILIIYCPAFITIPHYFNELRYKR